MRRHRTIAAALYVVLLGWSAHPNDASALEAGLQHTPAVGTSAAAPMRQALIVAPAPGGGAFASDAENYRDLLRRLGFGVTTIVADSRPELDANLRRFASEVRPGADVAVLVLGTVLANGQDLYLTPTPPASDLLAHPELVSTEGVRLADTLGRISQRGPKDLALVVDACRAAGDPADCQAATSHLPDGISALVAYRAKTASANGPVARLASLRSDLAALMTEPGLTFFALYDRLKSRLDGTDMALAGTPSLSRSFAFLPADFLARLPTRCNEVEATTDQAAVRSRTFDSLLAACTQAAATYDFAPYFKDKLAIVREQAAFQRAVAGCDTAPAEAYLRDYPAGAFRDAVQRMTSACEDARRARQQPPPTPDPPPAPPQPQPSGLVPRGDQPASFACGPALSEPVAQLICADADLAGADFRLGVAFRQRLARSGSGGERRAVIALEREWVRRRVETCGLPDRGRWDPSDLARYKPCILAQTRARIEELER